MQKDIIIPASKPSQKFGSSVNWQSSIQQKEAKLLRRRKIALLIIVIVFVLLVIAGVCGLISNLVNSAAVEVVVAPTDATIRIDGKEVDNGTHRMPPGTYDYTIERDGFVSQSGTIEVADGGPTRLYACLDTTETTTGWYDDNSTDDASTCQQALDYLMFNNGQAWLDSDPILRVIPYHNYNGGYNIDYAVSDDGSLTITITTLTCQATRADSLYQNAINYLTDQGINPDNYNLVHKSGCE